MHSPLREKDPHLINLPTSLFDAEHELPRRALRALQRGPIHYPRDNVIVCEGDPADFMFFIVSGAVRACRTFQLGQRAIVAFYLPGELFGWTNNATHSLSIEATSDALVLFLKRGALHSIASDDRGIAHFLQTVATDELLRTQEHAVWLRQSSKARVAAFLNDLWGRLGCVEHLDLPMWHSDIADHLGLTPETLSRVITGLERAGVVRRVSNRRLALDDRRALVKLATARRVAR